MIYAFISDIHGNLHALRAVIQDAKSRGADRFIFLGDYIFDLPHSNEVLREIAGLANADVILGNKEVYLRRMRKDDQSDWIYDQMGAVYQTFRELTAESFAYLETLPEELFIPLPGGGRVYAHHCPREVLRLMRQDGWTSDAFQKRMGEAPFSHQEFLNEFDAALKRDDYQKYFGQIDADVIAFGHNHLQYHGYCGEKLIINPGSCGLPLGCDPRAAYTLLEVTDGGYTVTERRVAYDVEAAIYAAQQSKVCARGAIWSVIIFHALRTGQDFYAEMFRIADKIAASKGEKEAFYSNETWKQAYAVFADTVLP